MFKTLYRCVRAAARHESGPAAQSRLTIRVTLDTYTRAVTTGKRNAQEALFVLRTDRYFLAICAFVVTYVVLHGRSHTILIPEAPISIPVAKTRIPAAPVTCERICGST